MPIIDAISSAELAGRRVALVLDGGGAKCAYQAGVWRALWERGVRNFAVIAGTSGGALNAVLVASGPPELAKEMWGEIITRGVLSHPEDQRRRIGKLLLAYLLLLLPLLIGYVRFFGLWLDNWDDHITLPQPLTAAALFVAGAAAWVGSISMRAYAERSIVIPLFYFGWQRYREHALAVMFLSLLVGIASASINGAPEFTRLWFWQQVGLFFVYTTAIGAGFMFIREVFYAKSIFGRPELLAATERVLKETKYENCIGPVYACLGRLIAYVDPFDVHPLEQQVRENPITGEPEFVKWYDHRPKARWCPRYFDLRKEQDANWILKATSAIPFVFEAVTRPGTEGLRREDYADGGVADNSPVGIALTEKPDLVIVVGVDPVKPPALEDLQQKIETVWRAWFFSDSDNESRASEIRENWLKNLSPTEKSLLRDFSGPVDRVMGNHRIELDTPNISPDITDVDFLFIRPSKPIAPPFPLFDQLAALKFETKYAARLQDLGYKDGLARVGG